MISVVLTVTIDKYRGHEVDFVCQNDHQKRCRVSTNIYIYIYIYSRTAELISTNPSVVIRVIPEKVLGQKDAKKSKFPVRSEIRSPAPRAINAKTKQKTTRVIFGKV